jgi:hypothetical protein
MVQFKCHSLDTLSGRGRPFRWGLSTKHRLAAANPQARRTSDHTFANQLRRSTVDPKVGHSSVLFSGQR